MLEYGQSNHGYAASEHEDDGDHHGYHSSDHGVHSGSSYRYGGSTDHAHSRPRGERSRGLPHIIRHLARRERMYVAKLREAAVPVGRHLTGSGRPVARDPLSFGFDGSMVIDEGII